MAIIIVTDLRYKDTTEEQRIKILAAVTQLSYGLRAYEEEGFLYIGIDNMDFEMQYLDPSKLTPVISPILAEVGVNVTVIQRFAFFSKEGSAPSLSFSSMLDKFLHEKPQTAFYSSILHNMDQCLKSVDARHNSYRKALVINHQASLQKKRSEMKAASRRKNNLHSHYSPEAYPEIPTVDSIFTRRRNSWEDNDDPFGYSEIQADWDEGRFEPIECDSELTQYLDVCNRSLARDKENILYRVYRLHADENQDGLDVLIANPFEQNTTVSTIRIPNDPEMASAVRFTFQRVEPVAERFWDGDIKSKFLEIEQEYIATSLRAEFNDASFQCTFDHAKQSLTFTLVPFFVPPESVPSVLSKVTFALYKAGLANSFMRGEKFSFYYSLADQKFLEPIHVVKDPPKSEATPSKESILQTVSSSFFKTHPKLSPKVWRKHPAVPSTQFVMFKPTDKKVAEELKSTLSENGLHAYVSQGKDSKVAVYVNLKK